VVIAQWRFRFIAGVLALIVVALIWHLVSIQVLPGEEKGYEFLQGQGDARTVRVEELAAHRGVITDRNGEPLAVSSPVVTLWANPSVLAQSPQVWPKLARALDLNEGELGERIKRYSTKEFMYLRRHMPPQDADKVLVERWPGVYGKTEYQRYYPAGEVAAHLVGFTNVDEQGQEGMELAYDEWLQGDAGAKQVVKDLKGRIIKDDGLIKAPEPGSDLMLSIDLRMQYLAYRELKLAINAYKALAGSVVVMDTRTGEVLAVANQPSYNPNNRVRLREDSLRNRAITDQFEPGSTMKAFTVLTALESGRYTPETLIDANPGYIRVGRKTLRDHSNYGVVSVTKLLTKSSQVATTKIALDIEPEVMVDTVRRMGFGQLTGTGFPGEAMGVIPSKKRWDGIERASFAFGHGMSSTVLQLAQAYGVLANRGIKLPTSLLKLSGPATGERVADARLTEQVVQMLKTVVGPEGTARRANLKDYQMAGKTGTVHKVGSGGYSANRYMGLFAGLIPADAPRIVVAVVINEPTAGEYYGGAVAAPVAARVAEGVLRLMQVPPRQEPPAAAAVTTVAAQH
jgi:cell division protein FtsI (penicillin-binding protein 3)